MPASVANFRGKHFFLNRAWHLSQETHGDTFPRKPIERSQSPVNSMLYADSLSHALGFTHRDRLESVVRDIRVVGSRDGSWAGGKFWHLQNPLLETMATS